MDKRLKAVLSPPLGTGLRNQMFSVLLPAIFRDIARWWKMEHGSFGDYIMTTTLAVLGDENARQKLDAFFVRHGEDMEIRAGEILDATLESRNIAARAWAKDILEDEA